MATPRDLKSTQTEGVEAGTDSFVALEVRSTAGHQCPLRCPAQQPFLPSFFPTPSLLTESSVLSNAILPAQLSASSRGAGQRRCVRCSKGPRIPLSSTPQPLVRSEWLSHWLKPASWSRDRQVAKKPRRRGWLFAVTLATVQSPLYPWYAKNGTLAHRGCMSGARAVWKVTRNPKVGLRGGRF